MANQANQKPKNNSHLKDLILLFAVPIGVAVFAAAVIYIPRLLANPKHDFIYYVCDYSCRDTYSVDTSGYIYQNYTNSYSTLNSYNQNDNLNYYNVTTDSSKKLTIDEAKQYRLDTNTKSQDGYVLKRESSSGGFLFWGDYEDGWYLQNGAKKKKVDLSTNNSYYSGNINFLGWVVK
ncbi:MAG TPA: hypothetical protein VLF63_00795 [Patescibacteria group bacterium]|nr:hypothetical protein [Patescibacteria group bacterium]